MFRRILLLALAVVCLAWWIAPLSAQDDARDLFLPTNKRGSRTVPPDKTVTRTQTVTINWKLFDKLASGSERSLQITAFDGATYNLTVSAVERREADCYTIFATINGELESQVLLTREHDALAVSLRTAGDVHLSLQNAGNGVFHLVQHDDSKFPPCGGGVPCGDNPAPPPPNQRSIQSTTYYNILVCYTPATRNAAGGDNQIRATAQQAIDAANNAYANSGLDMRAVNAGVFLTNYDQTSGTYSNHLSRLRSTNDGFMDEIHTLRNQYQADLVCLLVEGGEYCGIAYLSPTNQANGFSVVSRGCAVGNLTFAHEVGHNMGCGHDAANGNGVFAYSHGWRFTANGGQQRTVMAYAPGTRRPYFSNPNVTYFGVPTGDAATADNARTIRETIGGIALFRNDLYVDTVAGLDSNGGGSFAPLKTVARAVELAPSTVLTRVYVKAGNYNERPRVTKKISFRNWTNTGNARIGTP